MSENLVTYFRENIKMNCALRLFLYGIRGSAMANICIQENFLSQTNLKINYTHVSMTCNSSPTSPLWCKGVSATSQIVLSRQLRPSIPCLQSQILFLDSLGLTHFYYLHTHFAKALCSQTSSTIYSQSTSTFKIHPSQSVMKIWT